MKKVLILALALSLIPTNTYASSLVNENQEEIVIESKDDEDYDDSILTNTSHKFYSDEENKAEITVNDSDAKIYVNGKEYAKKDDPIKDGKNTIDVFDADKDTKVEIKSSKKESKSDNDGKLDENTLSYLEDLLDNEVKKGFAGGQITVIKDNKEIYSHNFGYLNNFDENNKRIKDDEKIKVNSETMFDLASNTKMYVTNYALQKLVYEKKIDINDKISKFFPEFMDKEDDLIKGKNDLTIKDLLMHQGGFPADPQYHNDNYDKDDGIKNEKNDLFSQDMDKTLEMILKTLLEYHPGEKNLYSDVDYMLLGAIVEKVSGLRLDHYFNENFAKPLGLRHTLFNPLENGFKKTDTAATELHGNTRDGVVDFKNIRKDTVWGEVHDEKAYYAMDGISGHAGLFSNSKELAKLANIMLNDGKYENLTFWDKKTQDLFLTENKNNPSYGLGWRKMGEGRYAWAFSNLASNKTYGHTGWTGTLSLIDPVENMVVILLTNKKNSPLIDKNENPNKFYSDRSMSAGYGAITSLIYKSLDKNDPKLILDLAKEMMDKKLLLVENVEGYNNIADYNDYLALKETYFNYLAKYEEIKENEEASKEKDDSNISEDDKIIDEDDKISNPISDKSKAKEKDSSNSLRNESEIKNKEITNPKTGIKSLSLYFVAIITSLFILKRMKRC